METHESPFFSSPFSSKPDIDLTELNRVIALRLDEITANIIEQIRLSGYENKLGAGVIITGGASQLKNLTEYLGQKLKMPIRRATAKKSLINNAPELIGNPSFTQVLGMLLMGQESCKLDIEEVVEKSNEDHYYDKKRSESKQSAKQIAKESKKNKKSTKQGLLDKFGDVFGNMFSDDDE